MMMFNPRTRIYTVHIKPESSNPLESAIFLREGFNWWAFIFGPLWALYHRLWWVALLFLAVNAALGALSEDWHLNLVSTSVIQLGFQLIVAYIADELLRNRLRQQGYIVADIVTGENDLRATQRFFDRHLSAMHASA